MQKEVKEIKKVIILGGGIGGLSAAHELSKYPDDFDVTIMERNSILGGQAAEYITATGDHTALCWHAVSNNYKYFLDIMDEIIDEAGIKVISHLKPINRFVYAFEQENYIELENAFITTNLPTIISSLEKIYKRKISIKDKYRLLAMYVYALSICDDRLKDYDKILWKDYICDISPDIKRWILDSTSIFLGMEYNKISVHFMFTIMRSSGKDTKLDKTNVFYSFDDSMYKVLYKPWKVYLESRGVKIILKTDIEKIHYIENFNTISTITVRNAKCGPKCSQKCNIKHVKKPSNYSADIFINSMGGDSMAKLHPVESSRNKFEELYNAGRQIQTQVLYYLPYKLQPLGTTPTVLIIPNSVWFLMVKIEGDIWELSHYDLLSCGIGIWDTPGLNGKKAIECTREELAVECWNQINKYCHNLKLSSTLPRWDIWDSFKFNNTTKELDTFEPKFSNNVNTLSVRPDYQDSSIVNLYHGNAIAKTTMNIYNMESAAEAGISVARIILEKKRNIEPPNFVKQNEKFWIRCIRYLDRVNYKVCKFLKNKFTC